MQTDIRYFPHLYRDSVALMRLSADLAARPGVDQASLLMGTPANMDLLVDSGLVDAPPPAAPGDIVFVARGEPDALAAAYEAAGQALTQGESRSGEEGGEGVMFRPRCWTPCARPRNRPGRKRPGAISATPRRTRARLGWPSYPPPASLPGPKLSRPCAPGCTP